MLKTMILMQKLLFKIVNNFQHQVLMRIFKWKQRHLLLISLKKLGKGHQTYLKNLSNITSSTWLGPVPYSLMICSFSGQYPYSARNWQPASRNSTRKCFASDRAIFSSTFCLASRFTAPGKTQYSTAFRMMPRFDLVAGCLYSLGPAGDGRSVC